MKSLLLCYTTTLLVNAFYFAFCLHLHNDYHLLVWIVNHLSILYCITYTMLKRPTHAHTILGFAFLSSLTMWAWVGQIDDVDINLWLLQLSMFWNGALFSMLIVFELNQDGV